MEIPRFLKGFGREDPQLFGAQGWALGEVVAEARTGCDKDCEPHRLESRQVEIEEEHLTTFFFGDLMIRSVLPLAVFLSSCVPAGAPPVAGGDATARCGQDAQGNRTFAVLHFNDTSRIGGLLDDRGGLARVRQLRTELEEECGGSVLVTVGGDVLYPSLLSRAYGGVPMVDALNRLDGKQDEVDPYLFATFGNSDFTPSSMKDAPQFASTLRQSQFTWLHTNIRWIPSAKIEGDMLSQRALVDLHGVQVGLFGLTTDQKKPAYGLIETDYGSIATSEAAALREGGADVVLALTHLELEQDKALLSGSSEEGPDLVLGGQPDRGASLEVDGRWILKGQAEAASVRVAWITVATDGSLSVQHETVSLGADTHSGDPALSMAVDAWWRAFDAAFCEADIGCLQEQYSHTKTLLHGSEKELRGSESALGNWAADVYRGAFENADVALVNAGALRIGQDLPPYTLMGRRVVEELVQYENELVLVELTGARLAAMLEHSVTSWPSSHFLQVSGLVYRHNPGNSTVSDIHLVRPDGLEALADDASVRVVMPRFLADPTRGDQDGYGEEAAGGLSMTDVTASESSMREALVGALKEAGKDGISPEREGRICRTDLPDRPCLLSVD